MHTYYDNRGSILIIYSLILTIKVNVFIRIRGQALTFTNILLRWTFSIDKKLTS